MMPLSEMKPDQLKFMHEYVRRALVGWCAQGFANGDGSFTPLLPDDLGLTPERLLEFQEAVVQYARSKKWVSVTDCTMTMAGYKTARGMMKIV